MKIDYKKTKSAYKYFTFPTYSHNNFADRRKKLLEKCRDIQEKSESLQKLLILEHCKTIEDIYFAQSIIALKKNHHEKAIRYLKQCIEKKEGDTLSHLLLADTLLKLNRPFQAINTLKKAIQISPKHYKLHNTLGIALRTIGKDKDAKKAFYMASMLQPRSKAPYINLTNLHIDNQHYSDAISSLTKLLFLSNQIGIYMKKIGFCHLKLGDIDTALFWYGRSHTK